MQTTEYQVIGPYGAVIATGPNRQQPIRAALDIFEHLGPVYTQPPFKVVRVVTETEVVGWVFEKEHRN